MRFLATNILWDTDGEEVDLPQEWTVEADDIEGVADALSDEFGWCVFSVDAFAL